MSDFTSSARSSVLSSAPSTPTTPSPQNTSSNRSLDAPDALNPERTSRLPSMPASNSNLKALQTMMTQMQNSLQHHLQQQQRDFEVRMESLLIGRGKGTDPLLSSIDKSSFSTQPAAAPAVQDKVSHVANDSNIGVTSDDPILLHQHPAHRVRG